MIRFFANDGSGWRLWMEVPVMAVTVSATVAGWGYQLLLQGENAFVLPADIPWRSNAKWHCFS